MPMVALDPDPPILGRSSPAKPLLPLGRVSIGIRLVALGIKWRV
jgi:hypothetical protein